MNAEREKAGAWYQTWTKVLWGRSKKDCIRWQKRVIWALHRWERARRAELPAGPKCWFCERPGHDESEEACSFRTQAAAKWELYGRYWRREEATK
jgi:hypothetical protein